MKGTFVGVILLAAATFVARADMRVKLTAHVGTSYTYTVSFDPGDIVGNNSCTIWSVAIPGFLGQTHPPNWLLGGSLTGSSDRATIPTLSFTYLGPQLGPTTILPITGFQFFSTYSGLDETGVYTSHTCTPWQGSHRGMLTVPIN